MKVSDVEFKPGETVVSEGDPGYVDDVCTLYHIQSGGAEVLKKSGVARKTMRRVAVLGPDDLIGDMSMLLHEPRSATVRVPDDAKANLKTLCIITKGPEEFAEKMSSLAGRNWVQLAKRLRDTTQSSVEKENPAESANGDSAPCGCE